MGQLINEMAAADRSRAASSKPSSPAAPRPRFCARAITFKLKDREVVARRTSRWISTRLAAAGTMAGSGGVIVMDDSRDMVWTLNNINEFYAHESCGQCTPCREGSLWMKKITDRMLARRRRHPGSRDAQERRRQHRRPHHLRLRRSLRLADAKFPRRIPRRIRQPRAKASTAAAAAGIHAGRIDQRADHPGRSARPRSRLEKAGAAGTV